MGDEIFSDDRHFRAELRAAGWVPLADVLDALRDDAAYLRWAMQQTHVGEHQPTKFTGACWAFADYLAERFAPTVPEGADERNGHE